MPTICVDYYERQRGKYDKQLGQNVTAYKLAPVEALIALAGLGPRARRVIPKREGGYTYVQLLAGHENEVHCERSYLVFAIDAAQQAAVEGITRQVDLTRRAFVWQDEQWRHFPTKTQPVYQPPDHARYPNYRLPAPPGSSGTIETTAEFSGSGLEITRTEKPGGDPWWWVGGDTYPHKDLLRRCGCRWSKKRRQWYFIGDQLPTAIAELVEANEPNVPEPPVSDDSSTPIEAPAVSPPVVSAPEVSAKIVSPTSDASPPTTSEPVASEALPTEPEEPPGPRIIPPPVVPTAADEDRDEIQQALVVAQNHDYSVDKSPVMATNKLQPIGQAPLGELSGNISGSVFCYGYALHEGLLVYLNLGGPTTAVEAIIAKLQLGKPVNLNRWDDPAIELLTNPTPDDPRNPQRVRLDVFSQYLPEARFRSSILVDRRLTSPNYTGGAGVTFIMRTDDAQAQALLLHHVKETCGLPVFDTWTAFLWSAGQVAGLVRPTKAEGGIDLMTILLDDEAWSRLITGGIAQQTIQLPSETGSSMLNNDTRRALFDLLQDEALAVRVDEAIRATKKDCWRDHLIKTREIRVVIKKVLGPDKVALLDEVFALAKAQADY